MKVLAEVPIEVDTGQYIPKYQDRTYADMENEIASKLTQQPNFQAKVKMLAGECDIRTKELPAAGRAGALDARIKQVKAQMRAEGYCRPYLEVEKEIYERQEKWKDGGGAKGRLGSPPPARI